LIFEKWVALPIDRKGGGIDWAIKGSEKSQFRIERILYPRIQRSVDEFKKDLSNERQRYQ
jgi:hypothetical protein